MIDIQNDNERVELDQKLENLDTWINSCSGVKFPAKLREWIALARGLNALPNNSVVWQRVVLGVKVAYTRIFNIVLEVNRDDLKDAYKDLGIKNNTGDSAEILKFVTFLATFTQNDHAVRQYRSTASGPPNDSRAFLARADFLAQKCHACKKRLDEHSGGVLSGGKQVEHAFCHPNGQAPTRGDQN
jgi:hypothetical protein